MSLPQPLDPMHLRSDGELYKELVRDVCFLYHQLASYGHIMEDLDFVGDFPRPYWDLVNRIDTDHGDDRLIRSGILILFLAGIEDERQQSGMWISNHAKEIEQSLQQFVPEDHDISRLCDAVVYGLSLLKRPYSQDDRFDEDYSWAYHPFVAQYFRDWPK